MKTCALVSAFLFAACGGSSKPACPNPLCNGVCCAAGTECFTDTTGTTSCATTCTNSTQCPSSAPCCEPLLDGGSYTSDAVCTGAPTAANPYLCRCALPSDCAAGNSCVPAISIGTGVLSGPYVCQPNSGDNHDGCASPSICNVSPQYCAKDSNQNQFCSPSCTSDADCDNAGVACCSAVCRVNQKCCGLCGH